MTPRYPPLNSFRRFCRMEKGVAAVEFALIFPFLLTLYLGSVEATALYSMDRKVQAISGALGDLVARAGKDISYDELDDYFHAASGMMAPHSPDALIQTVTLVRVRPNGTTSVEWSQRAVMTVGPQMSSGHSPGSAYPLPQEMLDIAQDPQNDSFVVTGEASYAYIPLLGLIFDQPINLYRENFFMPRLGGKIDLEW